MARWAMCSKRERAVQSVLVVVPTYHEADNIQELVTRVFAAVADQTPEQVSVLFVDDNSQDGTQDKILEMAANERYQGRIHLLRRPGKMGLGSAYIAGFEWGLARGFDALIEMDADLSHDPKYLPEMVQGLRQSDVVVGSRYVAGGGTENWGLFRRLLSRFGSLYARTLLRFPINDATGGFNGWHARVLHGVAFETLQSEGYAFQIELKHRAWLYGASMRELPIVFVDRCVGQSKMSSRIVIEAMYSVIGFRRREARIRRGFRHVAEQPFH